MLKSGPGSRQICMKILLQVGIFGKSVIRDILISLSLVRAERHACSSEHGGPASQPRLVLDPRWRKRASGE